MFIAVSFRGSATDVPDRHDRIIRGSSMTTTMCIAFCTIKDQRMQILLGCKPGIIALDARRLTAHRCTIFKPVNCIVKSRNCSFTVRL